MIHLKSMFKRTGATRAQLDEQTRKAAQDLAESKFDTEAWTARVP
ncbi:hypothetical protein ACT3R5_12710 [Glutamicibacter sp. AOP5-A2-7]